MKPENPTTASRARFHPQLCYSNAFWWWWWWWWWKPALSIFRRIALENWRLKYIAIKRPVGEDLTVGAKRNLTILLASGQYIVNFDEDNLYADRYVERMGTVMHQRNLVAVTLSGWHNFFEAWGPCRILRAQLMGSRRRR